MKKVYIANFLAAGVGTASLSATTNVGASTCIVFDIQPRAINRQICDVNQVSLSRVHQMINQRNCRDIETVKSSSDNMLHL